MSHNKGFLQLLFLFLSLISTTVHSSNSSDILYEILPFIRVYKDGRVQRLTGTKTVPASIDPTTRVHSKDVEISPNLNVSVRLYMPENANECRKFPLLVYFHGGAFFTGSAFNPTHHNFLNSLVAKAKFVAMSVNYRLAPENPLPIGYQDSWLALQWAFSHKTGNGSDTWLRHYVDYKRVYLGGISAGGNIAHNMAILAGLNKMDGVVFEGMFLNFPHFWGKKLIGNEASRPKDVAGMESIWVHAYPNSTGLDDAALNPSLDPNFSKLACKRVLVYVAEKDFLKDRGWYYAETLRKSGWGGDVKVVEVKGKDHVFNLKLPNCTEAKEMLQDLASFLRGLQVLEHFPSHLRSRTNEC